MLYCTKKDCTIDAIDWCQHYLCTTADNLENKTCDIEYVLLEKPMHIARKFQKHDHNGDTIKDESASTRKR